MPSHAADEANASPDPRPITPQKVQIIRLALLVGSVGFGAVAWFLTTSGTFEPETDPAFARMLGYVFYGLVVLQLGGMLFMRQRAERAETPAQRTSLVIVGYALAESVTLFGAVLLLLTGSVLYFLIGLLLFLLAFVLFPIQPASSS